MQNYFRDLRGELFQYYDNLVAFTPKLLKALLVLFVAWIVFRQIRSIS